MQELDIEQVRADFEAIVQQAGEGHPTIITRHGRRDGVILALEEYERLLRLNSILDQAEKARQNTPGLPPQK